MGLFSSTPPIDLSRAVVVVTGGARGIGRSTATDFASRGATVWIGDIDDAVAAATADELGVHSRALDVTSRESWREFVEHVVATHGRLDVLVNNAGVMPVGPFTVEPDATTDLVLDVNVRGLLTGMKTVLPIMAAAGRGHIVNVASMAGAIPLPGMVTYNASKYAALGASLSARREYADTGVTVSAVLPAAVRTELSSGAQLGGVLPTVDPEDVAAAIVRSVRHPSARISVPGWVAPAWDLVAFVPERIEAIARRLVGDRQALALDANARRDYLDRLERHATSNADNRTRAEDAR